MKLHQNKLNLGGLLEQLKKVREEKGLSQRALSANVAIPQSHISKIENGQVDVQTSSLIELARALDLELMLVPRRIVPLVETLSTTTGQEFPRPAYRLGDGDDDA